MNPIEDQLHAEAREVLHGMPPLVTWMVAREIDQSFVPLGAIPAFRKAVAALAREGQALDLRLAMLLAWFKGQDLSSLGYPSFGAFRRENVEWHSSWVYSLMRLVQSPLDLVKQAAGDELISLATAATAPGLVGVDEQAEWLARIAQGDCIDALPSDHWTQEVLRGDDARTVHDARCLARLILSWNAPNRTCDSYIRRCYDDQRTCDDIIADAMRPPPVPDLSPPSWCGLDPAARVVGPWEEPRDLDHGLEQLDRLQAIRRGRTTALGMACEQIAWLRLFVDFGYSTIEAYAVEELGFSVRTMQRYRRLGRNLDWYPELRLAVERNLDLDRALAISRIVAGGSSMQDWIDIAHRVGKGELKRITARTEQTGQGGPEFRRVRRRVERADAEATATGKDFVAGPVELPELDPAGAPALTHAPPGLLEAAQWFLETVEIPPLRGYARAKERDHFVCQNPECARRTLRCHAHHRIFRSQGGGPDGWNIITLCPSCHLRLVHTGKVTVERHGDRLLWTYPDRRVWVDSPIESTRLSRPRPCPVPYRRAPRRQAVRSRVE